MTKIRIVVAYNDLKFQDAINDFAINDKFVILDFINDETKIIERIRYTKPDLVFMGDNFRKLKTVEVLENINKSYCEAITSFIIISNKKIPLEMEMYHKYTESLLLEKLDVYIDF